MEESKKSFVSGNEIADIIMKVTRDLGVRMNGTYGLSDQENHILVRQIISKRKDDVIQEYYQSFDSRNKTLEKIIEALKDPEVGIIGIYGQGGMGKTTLTRQVARRVEEEKLFDKVCMISVSGNSDIKEIQLKIANEMGMKLEEENVIGRAQILADSFSRQKSLVILDDLVDEINLGNKSYDPSTFKILLISRSNLLLSGCVKEKYMFPVGVLEEKEAKTLLRKVGGVVELQDSASESLVDKFAIKTCALSPHLILSIGSYLRGKSCCQWKIALEMLQDIKFTEFALQDMQCPYIDSSLIGAFSHCAQMGHHPLIMDFVKYYCSLNTYNRPDIVTIHYLTSYIKESNLLQDNYSSDHVIMRNEVKDFALSKASNQYNFFTIRNGKLQKWPSKNELENCTAIFLHSSVIINELPKGIHCPLVKVFHLDSNNPFLKIPDNFFRGMSKLLVLELFGLQLPILPPSISCLKDLRMLSLERCMLCNNLSIIGELEDLSILSLSGSEIESLPNEWGKLKKLEFFDISNCPKLKVIPTNVLSSLNSLMHFYTRNSLIQWWVGGQENYQSLNASLAGLSQWGSLRNLEIDYPNVVALPTNALFDRLERYKVIIGNSNTLSSETIEILNDDAVSESLAIEILNDDKVSKSLAVLQLKEGTNAQEKIKNLFKEVENLLLGDKLNGIGNVFRDMNLKEFSYLKHLSIVNNLDIQYIINSEDSLEAFPKLESLCLFKLPNMEKIICCNQLTNNSLGNLKTLEIQNCARLKNLFSISLTRLFTKAETIEVSECQSMEEIVGSERQENNIKKIGSDQLSPGFHFQNLMKLNVKDCGSLRYLLSFSMVTCLVNLNSLSVIGCKMMEEITAQEINTDDAKVDVFPKLKEFHLVCMERLRTIWHSQCGPDSYSMLDSVVIEECKNLVTIFPNHIVERFSLLVKLKIVNCPLVEEIFDIKDTTQLNEAKVDIFPKLKEFHLVFMERLRTIWHRQGGPRSYSMLDYVVIEECKNLVTIFPNHMAGRFSLLVKLKIVNCPLVEEIFEIKDITHLNQAKVSIFPKLEEFYLIGMERLTSIWHSQCGPHSYNMLDSVVIEKCPKLVTVFPNHMVGRISLLVRLKVVNCQSVEEIFDIKDTTQLNVAEKETCLRFVQIESLPNLGRIWSRDPKGILSFKYLKKVWVSKCPSLKNLIPISIANGLEYSESLTVRDCNSIEEIVCRE